MEMPKIFAAEASDSEHFGMDGKVGGGGFFFSKIFGDATNKMSVATKLQTMIFMAEQNSFG